MHVPQEKSHVNMQHLFLMYCSEDPRHPYPLEQILVAVCHHCCSGHMHSEARNTFATFFGGLLIRRAHPLSASYGNFSFMLSISGRHFLLWVLYSSLYLWFKYLLYSHTFTVRIHNHAELILFFLGAPGSILGSVQGISFSFSWFVFIYGGHVTHNFSPLPGRSFGCILHL